MDWREEIEVNVMNMKEVSSRAGHREREGQYDGEGTRF